MQWRCAFILIPSGGFACTSYLIIWESRLCIFGNHTENLHLSASHFDNCPTQMRSMMNGALGGEFSLQILLFSCCFVLCMSINYYSDCNDGSLLFWSHVFSCFNVVYSRYQCAKRFYYSFTKVYHNVVIRVTEPLDISYSAYSLDFGPQGPIFWAWEGSKWWRLMLYLLGECKLCNYEYVVRPNFD